jgi:cytochrome P450
MRLTLNIVMKTIFDRDVSDREAGYVARALDEVMNWYANQTDLEDKQELTPEDLRYQNAIEQLERSLYAMIHQHRDRGEFKSDLLSMLMQVQDADDGSKMSDRQLRFNPRLHCDRNTASKWC